MKKVVTMGEIMLRLSAPGQQKIQQVGSFDVVYGGGEANVAIGLSQLGLKSAFVSKLPDHALGLQCQPGVESIWGRYGTNGIWRGKNWDLLFRKRIFDPVF